MTARDLAGVLLKILGLVWVYAAVAGGLQHFMTSGQESGLAMFTTGVSLMLAFTALIGALLLVYGSAVAGVLVSETEPLSITATHAQLFAVLAGVVGLYFAVSGTATLIGLAYVTVHQPDWNQQPGFEQLWETQRVALATSTAETLLGVALVLGRNGLTSVWQRFRSQEIESNEKVGAQPSSEATPE